MHTLTLLAISLLAIGIRASTTPPHSTSSSSSAGSGGGGDAEQLKRLNKLAETASKFGNTADYNTAKQWADLTQIYGVSKGQPVCLRGTDDGKTKCWTPTTTYRRWLKPDALAQNSTIHPQDVVLQFADKGDCNYNAIKMLVQHPNIATPVAFGNCENVKESKYGCSAYAMAKPTMTVQGMLDKLVQDPNDSPSLDKSQIRKIVLDVAKGFLHVHKLRHTYAVLDPIGVHLFEESGTGHAKIADLRVIQKAGGLFKINAAAGLGSVFLDAMIGAFYYKAKKHAGTESPCVHPNNAVAEACEIVTNLDRISQYVQSIWLRVDDQSDMTTQALEQVIADQWLIKSD